MSKKMFEVVVTVEMEQETDLSTTIHSVETGLEDSHDVLDAKVTAIAEAGEDRD